MCALVSPAAAAAGSAALQELDATTLRALSDPGYVDASAYRERARALGVNLASTVLVPVRQPLPSMAHQRRREFPQPQGGLPQVRSFD